MSGEGRGGAQEKKDCMGDENMEGLHVNAGQWEATGTTLATMLALGLSEAQWTQPHADTSHSLDEGHDAAFSPL
eukprot:5583410-Alexandrium_andersonii.AAC.1